MEPLTIIIVAICWLFVGFVSEVIFTCVQFDTGEFIYSRRDFYRALGYSVLGIFVIYINSVDLFVCERVKLRINSFYIWYVKPDTGDPVGIRGDKSEDVIGYVEEIDPIKDRALVIFTSKHYEYRWYNLDNLFKQ